MVYCVRLPTIFSGLQLIAYNCNCCQKMWWFYDYQLWLSIRLAIPGFYLSATIWYWQKLQYHLRNCQLWVTYDLYCESPKNQEFLSPTIPQKWVIWVHNFVKFNCWPLQIAWQVAHLPACRPFLSTAATSLHHNQSTHSHSTTMAPSNIWQSILHFTSSLAKYGTYTWRPHTISDPSTSETTSEEQAIYAQCPSVSLLSASNQSLLDRLPVFAL